MPDAPALPTSAELRTRCTELAAKLIDQRSVATDKRDDSWAADVRETAAALNDYSSLTDVAERNERNAVERAAWDAAVAEAERRAADPSGRGSRGPNAAFGDLDTPELRTQGRQFAESEAYTRAREAGSFNVDETEVRNLLTGSSIGTSGSNNLSLVGQPVLRANALTMRRAFVRDLIPVQQTNLQVVPYVRELNAITNESGAGMVSEASAKPEVTIQFEAAEAPIRKIAAWIQVTEEAFADAPTLAGYVDVRLAYMLMVKEEQQILSGNGTAPQIRGILNTTGVQTQATVADDPAAAIGLAAGKIENVDGYADGVVISPITYWTGVVERHANSFDGQAQQYGAPFQQAPATFWGMNVVRTRALADNKALVGAFGVAAIIHERLGTTIRSTDSHASLFISNTLVVLAEKRIGLEVDNPAWFCDTTLSFS
jgi:HK97 family phage major capsid protein